MKNIIPVFVTSLALTAVTQAGETKAIIPPAAPEPSLWSWFAGGSVGYLTDAEEEIYTLHAGLEYRSSASSNSSHALFLEVGFTEGDTSLEVPLPRQNGRIALFETDIQIIPVTVNYKFEASITDKLNWYAGAGAGVAFWDGDVKITRANGNSQSDSQDDVLFYAHIFAGLTYDVSESFEVFLGARYIFMDDPETSVDLGGGGFPNAVADQLFADSGIDGDVQIELGARFNF